MTLNLHAPETEEQLQPRITVAGVGGAGSNAVNNMIQSNLEGVEFLVCNTDAQALTQSLCGNRLQLGRGLTRGLGGGSRPDVGRAAAEEAMDEIAQLVGNSDMLFIAAGMGGATGTGAAPVIARAAREKGILTVAVVTKPFTFEGVHRMKIAEQGIQELAGEVDTLIIIPNQNLFRIANEKTTFADAFKMADEVLYSGVRGVTDLVVKPGLINLDFADIRSVMTEMGKAMMGTGESEGDNRAISAAENAISNPLLDDVSMQGARGVLINITGGPDLTLFEVDEAANRIRDEVDSDANIIFGSTFDPSLEGRMRISVVATGIEAKEQRKDTPVTLSLVSDNGGQPAAGTGASPTPQPGQAYGHAPAQGRPAGQGQPAQGPAQPQQPQARPAQTTAQGPAHAPFGMPPRQPAQAQTQAQPRAGQPQYQPVAGGSMNAAEALDETADFHFQGQQEQGDPAPAPQEAPQAEAYDREEAYIPPIAVRPPRRHNTPGSERAGDPYQAHANRQGQGHAQGQGQGEPRRRGGLFSKMTGVFQGDRDKGKAPAAPRSEEPRLGGGQPEPGTPREQQVASTAQVASQTAPQQQAAQSQQQQAAQQPQQAQRGDAVSQPRLSGLDPVERQDAQAMEEDQLDIPAFLRRQAN